MIFTEIEYMQVSEVNQVKLRIICLTMTWSTQHKHQSNDHHLRETGLASCRIDVDGGKVLNFCTTWCPARRQQRETKKYWEKDQLYILSAPWRYLCNNLIRIYNRKCLFLCFLCTATVLSGSAQNLACGILIASRWSWWLASVLKPRAHAPSIHRCKRVESSIGKFGISGPSPKAQGISDSKNKLTHHLYTCRFHAQYTLHSTLMQQHTNFNNRPHRLHAVHEMQPTATDFVCLFVSYTGVLCKRAEPTEMPFGGWLMWTQETMHIRWGSRSDESIHCRGDETVMQTFAKLLWTLIFI